MDVTKKEFWRQQHDQLLCLATENEKFLKHKSLNSPKTVHNKRAWPFVCCQCKALVNVQHCRMCTHSWRFTISEISILISMVTQAPDFPLASSRYVAISCSMSFRRGRVSKTRLLVQPSRSCLSCSGCLGSRGRYKWRNDDRVTDGNSCGASLPQRWNEMCPHYL